MRPLSYEGIPKNKRCKSGNGVAGALIIGFAFGAFVFLKVIAR